MTLPDLIKHLKSPGVIDLAKFDDLTLTLVDQIINEQWDLLRRDFVKPENVYKGVILFKRNIPMLIIDNLCTVSIYTIPNSKEGHNRNNSSSKHILCDVYHRMNTTFGVQPILYKIFVNNKNEIHDIKEYLPPDLGNQVVDPKSIFLKRVS